MGKQSVHANKHITQQNTSPLPRNFTNLLFWYVSFQSNKAQRAATSGPSQKSSA
jgi:hypothetical protein